MKTYQIKMAFLAASFAVCLSLDAQLNQSVSASEPLVEANSAFALDLFNQLKGDSGNLFFSPYGISTVLALTYAGARGQTQKQMGNVLHFTNVPDVTSRFGLLQRHLLEVGRQKGVELNIANALWIQQGYPFLPDFLSAATGSYAANVNQADFKTAADVARNQINAWVAQQTRDKIQSVLPPGSIDASTRLVLANAIYFKGLWKTPYRKTRTANQPFYISPTN